MRGHAQAVRNATALMQNNARKQDVAASDSQRQRPTAMHVGEGEFDGLHTPSEDPHLVASETVRRKYVGEDGDRAAASFQVGSDFALGLPQGLTMIGGHLTQGMVPKIENLGEDLGDAASGAASNVGAGSSVGAGRAPPPEAGNGRVLKQMAETKSRREALEAEVQRLEQAERERVSALFSLRVW